MTLHDLITRKYPWQAERDGSYFGSPQPSLGTWTYVDSPAAATPPGKSKISVRLFKMIAPNRRGKQSPAGEHSNSGAGGLVEGRYEDLTSSVQRREQYACRSGGFADIWECDLTIRGTSRKASPIRTLSPPPIMINRSYQVAVKAVRPQRTDAQNLPDQEKKLRRELKVWDRLQHDNIVQLLGVVSGFGPLSSMVCPWFSNGSLSSYLSNHEAMDLSGRQGLLLDIASGLCYLHNQDVVHGDLHGGNVLVDENGRASLTDFGLSVILQEFPRTSYLQTGVCGAIRYADPKLVRQVHVDHKVVHPTKPSDIYSFGGLMLYVLSGKQPYEGITEFMLPTEILRRDRPPLPVDDGKISLQYEPLIQRCWSPEEKTRPSAKDIVTRLQKMCLEGFYQQP
ncbi:kinase-like protein [Paxillus ammoniavirescens]|nr:kinase-like protein [Paxillus ammoniavirescens]